MRRSRCIYIVGLLILIISLIVNSACDVIPAIEVPAPDTPASEGLTPDSEDSDLPTISAQAEDRPVINEFYADPNVVMAAASAPLHWNVEVASTVVIEPDIGEVPLSGDRDVNPLESTTYILTASNDAGSISALTEVSGTGLIATVVEAPPVVLTEFEEPPNPPAPLDLSGADGIAWIDTKTQEPVLRSTRSPKPQQIGGIVWIDLETKEPIPLPSDETPAVLPIIRRFEASPSSSVRPSWINFLFDVPNATSIWLTWSDVTGDYGWESLFYYNHYAEYVYYYGDVPHFWFWVVATGTFTLHARNSAGISTESVTIEIEQVRPRYELESAAHPTIHSFTADPEDISEGDRARLNWEVSNADFVNIACDDFITAELPLTGSIHVLPFETRSYTLSATNAAGTSSEEVVVTVERTPYMSSPASPLPIIESFTATPDSITAYGDSSTLGWTVSNADGVIISSSEGEILWTTTVILPFWNLRRVWPTETTVYRLTAYNTVGTRTSEVTVTAETGPWPVIHYFNADPENIILGERSRLSWEAVNADEVIILGPEDTEIRGLPLSGSLHVEPITTSRYLVVAVNGSWYWREDAWIIVDELPVVRSFTADPDSITSGDMSRLSWEVSNANSVTISNGDAVIAGLPLSGSIHVLPTETIVYQLIASNTVGITDEEVTVIVEEPPSPPPPPPPEVKKPDLVIKDIWRSGTNQWRYVIENQGEEDSKASTTALRIDSEPHTLHEIGSLAAGESREVYFTHSFTCIGGTSHSWAVVADANNSIDESNEANNSYAEKFICSK